MRKRRETIEGAALAGLAAAIMMMASGRASADPCAVGLRELRVRAVEHAGLAETPSLRRRARLAGLMPDVSVRSARGWAWDDPWTGVRQADDAVSRRDAFDVRLTWHLDRLVFDSSEPSVTTGERGAARARIELEDEVTTRYFRWRRAVLDAQDAAGAREELAAEEAFASLDAITGGWLSERARCDR